MLRTRASCSGRTCARPKGDRGHQLPRALAGSDRLGPRVDTRGASRAYMVPSVTASLVGSTSSMSFTQPTWRRPSVATVVRSGACPVQQSRRPDRARSQQRHRPQVECVLEVTARLGVRGPPLGHPSSVQQRRKRPMGRPPASSQWRASRPGVDSPARPPRPALPPSRRASAILGGQ